MKERIQIVADYEIEYEGIRGRDWALGAALEGGIDVRGMGPGGAYRATRLSKAIASTSNGSDWLIPKQESLL